VSQATGLVVVGADPGSKADAARRLGVEMINQEEFLRRVEKASQAGGPAGPLFDRGEP
jgi:BRCT domain type II-containing protein